MKNSEIMLHKCKRVAGNDTRCFNILMSLYDCKREDIIDAISNIMQDDFNAIKPEQIVKVYDGQCSGDIKKFIALMDKQFKSAKQVRRAYYDAYEEDVNKINDNFMTGKKEEPVKEFYVNRFRKYEG